VNGHSPIACVAGGSGSLQRRERQPKPQKKDFAGMLLVDLQRYLETRGVTRLRVRFAPGRVALLAEARDYSYAVTGHRSLDAACGELVARLDEAAADRAEPR
jgi:hypothetical protein